MKTSAALALAVSVLCIGCFASGPDDAQGECTIEKGDCPTGETCVERDDGTMECRKLCIAPADCPDETCLEGVCRPAGGEQCNEHADCHPGYYCGDSSRTCLRYPIGATSTCDDRVRGEVSGVRESDIDCGGPCDPCDSGYRCFGSGDCSSKVCTEGICQGPTCSDETLNGGESDQDCGHVCPIACGDGLACDSGTDCVSGLCFDLVCSSCVDAAENGNETDLNCGGADCPKCADGQSCLAASDCLGTDCENGTCVSCDDGGKNQDETDVNCGGDVCPGCPNGLACINDDDCGDGTDKCDDGYCNHCGDGVRRGPTSGPGRHEECDDGNNELEICTYGDLCADCQVCGPTCETVCGDLRYCGDGTIDEGFENCDTGLANSNDWAITRHCDAICQQMGPYCGDGINNTPSDALPGEEQCGEPGLGSSACAADKDCIDCKCESCVPACWRGIKQRGSTASDFANGVAVDSSGNLYVAGHTYGDLDDTNAGESDLFLAKYDPSGTWVWTALRGTAADDVAESVTVDASGNVYVAGATEGDLDGTNSGFHDSFVAKYDASGTWHWTALLGTSDIDWANGVAVDASGNAYVAGHTHGDLADTNAGSSDFFLAKYDESGALQCIAQRGTADEDQTHAVAVDSAGSLFLVGYTGGMIDHDIVVAKYDSACNWQWASSRGSASTHDEAESVAVDGEGNAYVAGRTNGDLDGTNAGFDDSFVAKYDASGSWQWTTLLGTPGYDRAYGVAVDNTGNVYVAGLTDGNLGGNTNAGSFDAFVAKLDPAGAVHWTDLQGTTDSDSATCIAVDASRHVYVVGDTNGEFGVNTNAGSTDIFIGKYDSLGKLK